MKFNEKYSVLAGVLLLIVSMILMNIGIDKGENIVVLQKAIRICMECIGIS